MTRPYIIGLMVALVCGSLAALLAKHGTIWIWP
jgi:hypothetical protein